MAAMATAVCFGPMRMVVRSALRLFGGKALVTCRQRSTTLGLAGGLMTAPVLSGAMFGGEAAVTAAVLGILLLLWAMDLAWRWLPLEWTVPLLLLGLFAGFLGDRGPDTLAGAAAGAGLLWALQIIFRRWREVEAVGTGDIWLAAGLGSLGGLDTIAWVLGLAALSGLAGEALRKSVKNAKAHNRRGVAFGAHLIGVFVIVLAL